MSFRDLDVENMPFAGSFANGEDRGRRHIAISMERLDRSWDIMVKSTMSIVAITMAVTEQSSKLLVKNVILGMVNVLDKITETSSKRNSGSKTLDESSFGGVASGGGMSFNELRAEANRIGEMGENMFLRMDSFGRAIMENLVILLPSKWRQHIDLLEGFVFSFNKDLTEDDASFVAGMLFAEQCRITHIFVSLVSDLLAEPYELNADKTGYQTFSAKAEILANEWLDLARPLYNEQERHLSSVNSSSLGADYLSKVIQRLGFPDIASKIM